MAKRRMLLVASVGVATVSYVLACDPHPSAGNLMPAPAPQQPLDADGGAPTAQPSSQPTSQPVASNDAGVDPEVVSPVAGNLMVHGPAPAPTTSGKKKHGLPSLTPPTSPVSGNMMPPPEKK